MKTYAIIPTKDREEMLHNCVASLLGQVEKVIIINTRPDGYPVWWGEDRNVVEIPCYVSPTNEPNISYWWNLGLDVVHVLAEGEDQWNALIVNDDVEAPPNLATALNDAMRATTAVLASPDQQGDRLIFHGENSTMELGTRMTGYAFMLRGEHELRVDESLKWWWSDTDLEMRARQEGGSVLVPNCAVQHHDPNGYTTRVPELSHQATLDRQTYIEKWGFAPW